MVEEIPILSAHIEGTIRAIAKLHATIAKKLEGCSSLSSA